MKRQFAQISQYLFIFLAITSVLFFSMQCHRVKPETDQDQGQKSPRVSETVQKNPKMVISKTSFDLGEVHKGDKIRCSIGIENQGGSDLQILSVRPCMDCDDVAVMFSREKIRPGGYDEIVALVLTDDIVGQFTRTLEITTNDPVNVTSEVTLTGIVNLYVDIFPGNLLEIRTNKGESLTKHVALINHTSQHLELLGVKNGLEGFSVTYEPYTEQRWIDLIMETRGAYGPAVINKPENADYIVSIKLESDARVGEYEGIVVLKTNLAQLPTVQLNVRGLVAGPIKIFPKIAFWPDAGGTRAHLLTQSFRVVHTENKSFTILEITPDEPIFEFHFDRTGPYSFAIKITLTGSSFDHHKTGMITIKTDDPDQPVIILPYRIFGHDHQDEDNGHEHDHSESLKSH